MALANRFKVWSIGLSAAGAMFAAGCTNDPTVGPSDAGHTDLGASDSGTPDATFDAGTDAGVDAGNTDMDVADMPDLGCVSPRMMCGDVCATCPTTPGTLAIDCQATACVAVNCYSGYILHNGACIAGAWHRETISPVGDTGGLVFQQDIDIALDSSDHVNVVYYDYDNAEVRHAIQSGDLWASAPVTAAQPMRPPLSLAMDGSNRPVIAAQLAADDTLMFARYTGSLWQVQTVDEYGRVPSIAIDAAGDPHIAYFNDETGELRYASWTGSEWSSELVTATTDYFDGPSLAFGPGDAPSIAFHDVTAMSLRYARRGESGWTVVTVDDSADVGNSPSLSIDVSGRGHIAYENRTTHSLKYASEGESEWESVVVGLSGTNGFTQSLALASDGSFRITHENRSTHTLSYVSPAGAGFRLDTADDGASVGYHSVLVLDSMDFPHIVYTDFAMFGVKYATLRAE